MNFSSPRTILIVIALVLTALCPVIPIPVWVPLLLVEVALLIP